ncbi:MAG: hypothetical protein AAGK71_13355 [Pseudomonadota bacterium]
MSSALKANLHQDRRRLSFVIALAYLAGVLFFWRSHVYLGHVHISLVTGLIYAVIVGIAAVTVCLCLPRLRFMMEAMAMSRLTLAVTVMMVPDLGKIVLSQPFLMALILVAGGACLSRLLHGRIDRGPKTFLAFGPHHRQSVTALGTPFQRGFVAWVDGTGPMRIAA